ncbi:MULTISPECIES: hypothetical protein [Spirosoma]|uniref:DUF4025 domain-containing protein n=1 Tax=Spirosoma liriopis TaxID=2937440 RepID=A0ABT0HRS5_9BACT|nr:MULTISPECIES: hypothetical protein [Spirosoma]MCK8494225.1 hypothetical protein [Spirosoma liriopis]UHG89237.1 hypothetical protein LQ777_13390 [Spirosoma oryzicola]
MESSQHDHEKVGEPDFSAKPDVEYLVGEEHDDVDASGVDDHSTGMGEDDYLGKTNREGNKDE